MKSKKDANAGEGRLPVRKHASTRNWRVFARIGIKSTGKRQTKAVESYRNRGPVFAATTGGARSGYIAALVHNTRVWSTHLARLARRGKHQTMRRGDGESATCSAWSVIVTKRKGRTNPVRFKIDSSSRRPTPASRWKYTYGATMPGPKS